MDLALARDLGLVVGVSLVSTILSRFLPGYIGEKGKNLATKEDIGEITERIEAVKAEYAEQLDKTREVLRRQASLEDFARDFLASAHGAATERRLVAVETLWQEMCDASHAKHQLLFLADVLSREELAARALPAFAQAIQDLDFDKLGEVVRIGHSDKCRPFCGEALWAIYYVATWLPGRILAFYATTKKDAGVWMDDKPIRDFLAVVLDDEEMRTFVNRQGAALTWLHSVLQLKFLRTSADFISGKTVATAGIEQARHLATLIAAETSNKALQQPAGGAGRS
jgi:hypothetical protein